MLLTVGFLTVVCLTHVAGQCTWVTLDGTQYNSDYETNGEYELMSGESCDDSDEYDSDDRNVWIQRYGGSVENYIFYYDDYGWVVAPFKCQSGKFSAKASGSHDYPYDVPMGEWFELEQHADDDVDEDYFLNPNLHIYCSPDDLTGWEIFGIVVGCLCGVILISLLIAYLCAYRYQKKADRAKAENTAANATASTAAGWAAAGNVATISSTRHSNTYDSISSPHQYSAYPAVCAAPSYYKNDPSTYMYESGT